MRHLIKGRRLNRSPSHLLATKRNLACSLFVHERINTTVPKAKELRPFAERIITIARKGSAALEQAASQSGEDARVSKAKALHARRRIMSILGGKKRIVVGDDVINVVDKLMNEIGPRFQTRPGGYTRILKRTKRRLGDAAPVAFIELLAANEDAAKEAAPAPAPVVSEDE
ncbi:50S ribosomal protein L17 [Planctomycetes bacterium Pan216]|uniref:Large ribosomal subunit protein bL17 n=1 Tax=Kolteria novifilia TaxID=2527975 RepID=A0A518AZP0_9BACT|nr:50S ribosomal protein L17 [Planctomycetes bacterium Pan216]